MNKSGIELSINFIIMFILAMAMFSAGIIIAREVFFQANITKDHLTEQQRAQLEQLLMDHGKVQTVFVKKELKPGEDDVFGLGIRNDYASPVDFFIYTQLDAAYTLDPMNGCDDDVPGKECTGPTFDKIDEWLYIDEGPVGGPYDIKPDQRKIHEIFLIVPTKVDNRKVDKGTYIFNVKVCYGTAASPVSDPLLPCKPDLSNQYDVTKKFTVIVK